MKTWRSYLPGWQFFKVMLWCCPGGRKVDSVHCLVLEVVCLTWVGALPTATHAPSGGNVKRRPCGFIVMVLIWWWLLYISGDGRLKEGKVDPSDPLVWLMTDRFLAACSRPLESPGKTMGRMSGRQLWGQRLCPDGGWMARASFRESWASGFSDSLKEKHTGSKVVICR